MKLLIALFFLIRCSIFAVEVDFDYVFVGTSPISLMEALYRSYSGSRILILETSPTLGGAWKTIDICGVSNVDMGCHQIGMDPATMRFLEKYVGCRLVPMNNPRRQTQVQSGDEGVYFSGGCHELLSHLQQMIQKSTIVLLLDHKLESAFLDFDRSIVEVKTRDKRYRTHKIVAARNSSIEIENLPKQTKSSSSKHHHLYLLIEDRTPVRFTYYNTICSGMSRMFNVTLFSSELEQKGQQLIAIQVNDRESLAKPHFFLEELKKKKLVDSSARLLLSDQYIYEQSHFNQSAIQNSHPNANALFEVLSTDAIWNIAQHATKWEKAFPLFSSY